MGDAVVSDWKPRPHRIAFGEFGSGEIISVSMDRHETWAATYALMNAGNLSSPPGTVTSEYAVRFLHPSDVNKKWQLSARATKVDEDRVNVSAELKVGGGVGATMTDLSVAVRESHPASYRWH